jgi:hypothetical protein
MALHKIHQRIMSVVIPASRIDMERHRDGDRLLKAYGPQNVFFGIHHVCIISE